MIGGGETDIQTEIKQTYTQSVTRQEKAVKLETKYRKREATSGQIYTIWIHEQTRNLKVFTHMPYTTYFWHCKQDKRKFSTTFFNIFLYGTCVLNILLLALLNICLYKMKYTCLNFSFKNKKMHADELLDAPAQWNNTTQLKLSCNITT